MKYHFGNPVPGVESAQKGGGF